MRQKLIKVLFIAIAMMSCINSVAYGSGSEEKKYKQMIIIQKIYKTQHTVRDNIINVNAVYYPDADIIELACDGTKETSVYIVNSNGEEISYDSFDAGMNPYYMVDVPQTPGAYYIVIDSPVLYAEGAFVVE